MDRGLREARLSCENEYANNNCGANDCKLGANKVQIRCKSGDTVHGFCQGSTEFCQGSTEFCRVFCPRLIMSSNFYRVLGCRFPNTDAVHTYCLSCSGTYLNLLTSRRILTLHLHVLQGITQSKQRTTKLWERKMLLRLRQIVAK